MKKETTKENNAIALANDSQTHFPWNIFAIEATALVFMTPHTLLGSFRITYGCLNHFFILDRENSFLFFSNQNYNRWHFECSVSEC